MEHYLVITGLRQSNDFRALKDLIRGILIDTQPKWTDQVGSIGGVAVGSQFEADLVFETFAHDPRFTVHEWNLTHHPPRLVRCTCLFQHEAHHFEHLTPFLPLNPVFRNFLDDPLQIFPYPEISPSSAIYISNIHRDTHPRELLRLTAPFGVVQELRVFRRPLSIPNSPPIRVSAYLRFANPYQAFLALQNLNHHFHRNRVLRVRLINTPLFPAPPPPPSSSQNPHSQQQPLPPPPPSSHQHHQHHHSLHQQQSLPPLPLSTAFYHHPHNNQPPPPPPPPQSQPQPQSQPPPPPPSAFPCFYPFQSLLAASTLPAFHPPVIVNGSFTSSALFPPQSLSTTRDH